MVKRLKLRSEISLFFNEFKEAKSTSIGIWIKKGARSEPLRVKGIAHFLEHLVFKGTKNYSHKEIKQEIEGRGGQLNAFTSQEVVCYFAKVLERNAEVCLDVLSDMVRFPLLKKEDVERERGVILEEIRMYRDMPSSRVSSILDSLLWEDNPLGIDVIGRESTVKKISEREIRKFKDKFYSPSNIVIVISGKALPKFFEKILAKFNSLSLTGRSFPGKFPKAKVKRGFKFKQEATSFEQTHISLGFEGFSYFHPQRFILELIHIILGGNMSSRLFEAIREERGLAYEVSTGVKKYRETGAFTIHCGLEEKNASLAFRIILKELKRLKEKLVAKSELMRAKDYFLGNFSMGLESTLSSMFYIGESICKSGKVLTCQEVEREILRISPVQIREIAKKVFSPDKLKIAVVTKRSQSFLPSFKKILNRIS